MYRKLIVLLPCLFFLLGCAFNAQFNKDWNESYKNYLGADEATYAQAFNALKAYPLIPQGQEFIVKTPNVNSACAASFTKGNATTQTACVAAHDANNVVDLLITYAFPNFKTTQGQFVRSIDKVSRDHEMRVKAVVETINWESSGLGYRMSATAGIRVTFISMSTGAEISGYGEKTISDASAGIKAEGPRYMILAHTNAIKGAIMRALTDAFPKLNSNLSLFEVSSSATTTSEPSNSNAGVSLSSAKQKCSGLGFKEGTEKFGECVLKLSE